MIAKIWQGTTSLNYMPRWLYIIVVAGFGSLELANLAVGNTNGTFASAIAAWLARGASLAEAVGRAKEYLTEALRHAYPIGHGRRPRPPLLPLLEGVRYRVAPWPRSCTAFSLANRRVGSYNCFHPF